MNAILSIDPGKYRSGLAVISSDKAVISKKAVKTLVLPEEITDLCYKNDISLIIIGNGGPGRIIEKKIASLNIKATILFVNEKGSTLEARKLYWKDNKPKGLLRFIPSSLLLPHEPYDDYAALVIGYRYLDKEAK